MDSGDLKAASNYVNNQLASRGLLRDSPIDFAKPHRDNDVPKRIINLVHELVQRRDKDAEQRENLALTIRTLKAAEAKHNATIDSLQIKISDLERKNSNLEAQVRTSNTHVRTAEASAKSLRTETLRVKTQLAQVRTQSANDLRKRDTEIHKLQKRLREGFGPRNQFPRVEIMGGNPVAGKVQEPAQGEQDHRLVYDTVEFLTTLSQNMADENDQIVGLMRRALSTLKGLAGIPDMNHNLDTIAEEDEESEEIVNPVQTAPADYDTLEQDLMQTVNILQDMLERPDYVPIEELEERDAEISQLRQTNDVLYEEWRKALNLVEEWNKGIMNSTGA
ncbi:Afadin and alpha-actinin-binding-domain-containing protein, partial [Pyronema omphalodes]